MTVTLMYFDGCPNWGVALDRLNTALAETGAGQPEVVLRRVGTPAEADELQFPGSPTVLIDSTDPFACGDEPVGCHAARTERRTDSPDPRPSSSFARRSREAVRDRGRSGLRDQGGVDSNVGGGWTKGVRLR